jgi:hypothetical protein
VLSTGQLIAVLWACGALILVVTLLLVAGPTSGSPPRTRSGPIIQIGVR